MNTICYEPVTRILVADHDDDNRSLVRAVLSMKGFEVLQAVNGEEAFSLAVERKPALLLIDLRLPVMSGIRVIRRLRESGLDQMPIIATSLERHISHRNLALAEGCVAHIEKPVEPDLLDDLLDQFLPGERASVISTLVH
jgi:two-component system cell cycle response regulator DivK